MIANDPLEPERVVRPWGLCGLRPARLSTAEPAYRYDDDLQVAVMANGQPWVNSEVAKEWSSVAELDGDEGRSETYGWDDGKDITEGV